MHYTKIKSDSDILPIFYKRFLEQKYSWNDLVSLPILQKFIKSDNMSCILCLEGKAIIGGIVYTHMVKSDTLFIHYEAAEKESTLLQLITLAMLDEMCDVVYTNEAISESIGFSKINVKYLKPKLSFERKDVESKLFVYGTNKIRKENLVSMLYEYCKRIAFIPKPEDNYTFLNNRDRIRDMISNTDLVYI